MVCAVMLLAALAWARVHPCRWVVVGLCMLLGSLGLCPGRWRGLCLASTRCVKSRGSSSDCLVMVACAWLMATAMLVKSRLRLSGCLWLLPWLCWWWSCREGRCYGCGCYRCGCCGWCRCGYGWCRVSLRLCRCRSWLMSLVMVRGASLVAPLAGYHLCWPCCWHGCRAWSVLSWVLSLAVLVWLLHTVGAGMVTGRHCRCWPGCWSALVLGIVGAGMVAGQC